MKIFRLFFSFALVLSAFSCSVKEDVTTIDITVIDGRNGKPVPNATVSIFTASGNGQLSAALNTQLTKPSGVSTFAVPFVSKYYVVAQTSTEKSYYNEGYTPIGVFQSQNEIDSSPAQTPAAVVGGVKFKDVNGDGKINASDVQLPVAANLTINVKNSITVTIF